jgi:hypothetical protein
MGFGCTRRRNSEMWIWKRDRIGARGRSVYTHLSSNSCSMLYSCYFILALPLGYIWPALRPGGNFMPLILRIVS